MMGPEPTGLDATAFAFVAGTLCPLFDTPLRTSAERHENLKRYVGRMTARFSRRDRRMRGCGLEATNATTRRRFCRFSGAMIRQRPTPMTQTTQNVSDTAFIGAV